MLLLRLTTRRPARTTTLAETLTLHRHFSSNNKSFNLKGLPFTVPPTSVSSSFRAWTVTQGIDKLINLKNCAVTPTYMPFYVFDFNMKDNLNKVTYHQGLPIYAGYNYRRSLANSAHDSTFSNNENISNAELFEDKWLNRIYSPAHNSFSPTQAFINEEVVLDTWKSHRSSCWRVAMSSVTNDDSSKFELINSNRAYLPVYIVEYTLFNLPFRVAISGCDKNINDPIIHHLTDHRFMSDEMKQNFANWIKRGGEMLGNNNSSSYNDPYRPNRFNRSRDIGTFAFYGLLGAARFVLSKLPMFLIAGLLFGVSKKLLYPFYVESANWEESQKEKEFESRESGEWKWKNTFKDVGGEGRRNFKRQESRQQQQQYYEKRQGGRQQQQSQRSQQQQQQKQRTTGTSSSKVKFDFDTTDPYAVLVLDKSKPLTKQSLSQAFRREMMKWHPDRYHDATEERKLYATERTKLITNHYTQLRKRF
ncbi:hypothetical protein TL16_g12394 [Triparma laevis f. inornata]|uniref:J domain-containing protein n=2 Tax=Triparma laevis TaxID=1534972 RepID=A0A9W7FD61_9STRA|nr:hypothetical protein TL16_g12394 [Triparma laevis f. inornata]GMI10014.1 hypothetical protein TrLO_g15341 [Triparma laevis f. longispina]